MKLNVAVQMDPIERINVRGDSTFALLLEAQKRGHGLSYYTPDKLSLRGEELVAPVQLLTVRDEPGDHFTLGEARCEPLAAFDVILLRQDPPFDLAYITSTHFLERIHPKTLVVNDPASVRNAPEKIFVMDFPHLMPPTLISRDLDEINSFRDEHGAVVMKPLHGHGGAAVFRIMPQDMNFGSLFDMFTVTFREPWVIQRFLPEVKHGDKRIILVDGEFAGAVNRVPAADDLRSNMVRGGAAQATDLTPREREICAALGPLRRVGWVERLVRRSSMSEGGSDTHQLHFMDIMGFATAQPILRPHCDLPVDKSLLAMTLANIRSPDGAQRNPGLTRRRPRIARSLSSGGASRRPVGSIRATAADNKTGTSDLPVGQFVSSPICKNIFVPTHPQITSRTFGIPPQQVLKDAPQWNRIAVLPRVA